MRTGKSNNESNNESNSKNSRGESVSREQGLPFLMNFCSRTNKSHSISHELIHNFNQNIS